MLGERGSTCKGQGGQPARKETCKGVRLDTQGLKQKATTLCKTTLIEEGLSRWRDKSCSNLGSQAQRGTLRRVWKQGDQEFKGILGYTQFEASLGYEST